MSFKRIIIAGMFFLFMFSGWGALAQENLSCADIEWKSAVTDRYPNISDACIGVFEKDGQVMAKVKMQVDAVKNNKVSFRFLEANNTLSKMYQADLDAGWSKAINEKLLSEKEYGFKLSAYIPYDRWAMISGNEEEPNPEYTMEIYDIAEKMYIAEAGEQYEADMNQESDLKKMPGEPEAYTESKPAMPATAGLLPLIGLLGAGFMVLGMGIRFLRYRFK